MCTVFYMKPRKPNAMGLWVEKITYGAEGANKLNARGELVAVVL